MNRRQLVKRLEPFGGQASSAGCCSLYEVMMGHISDKTRLCTVCGGRLFDGELLIVAKVKYGAPLYRSNVVFVGQG